MPGYALLMLMKHNLCAAIINPSGYVVIGESGRSNRASEVARRPATKWRRNHNSETEVDPEEKRYKLDGRRRVD